MPIKDPIKRREQNRRSHKKYYENHREEELERHRKWRVLNPEKSRECQGRYRKEHPDSVIETRRKYERKNREKLADKLRIYWKKYPQRYAACKIVTSARQNGRVHVPAKCSKCGKRKRIEGHHYDYSRPLDLTWVCSKCHHDIHRSMEET